MSSNRPNDPAGEVQLKIISGGQTGVDRAALDVALELGLPCGGWCPKGRRAEDGAIPDRYPLTESDTADYSRRTRLNVRDSDATLILTRGKPDGGTALTARVAAGLGKPQRVIDLGVDASTSEVTDWLLRHHIRVLNIAGPRESRSPGIQAQARRYLRSVLSAGDDTQD